MKKNKLTIDYETRSCADLKKIGAVKYAQDPSTEILCLAYKFNNEKTKLWVPSRGSIPKELTGYLKDPSIIISAHNALFEQVITKYVLSRLIDLKKLNALPPSRFTCTAAKAAAVAIPRNLEGAGAVMELKIQKDAEGNRLMKKYMKPTLNWSKWNKLGREGVEPKKWYDDELELEAIYDYCMTDVETEYLLDKSLPDLSPYEREVWLLNQEMNLRGVQIDIETVTGVLKMIEFETKKLQAEAVKLTGGKIKSILQRDEVLKYLRGLGLEIPNMQAGTIAEILNVKEIGPTSRRLLEIRQQVSKTSNKKYFAFLERAGVDGRVRDLALYHGAATGRESGTGIQVHNMPKGKIKNSDFVIEHVLKTNDLDFIRLAYGDPFEVFSSCARGMITASTGFKIFAADYNAIECRILNWIAGNESVLKDFRNGEDPYVKMAARVLNKKIEDVTGPERQFGKVVVLACGYQMGPDRFLKTCHDWGVKWVTESLAIKGVKIFRESNKPIVDLWANIERAAIKAVQKKGTKVSINKTTWVYDGLFLKCLLPSGRAISFHSPTVRNEPTPWGEMRPKLYHWYVDSLTKKWVSGAQYGGQLVENICQGTARDIMVNGSLKARAAGYLYLFNVHDECVCESESGSIEEFTKIMVDLPVWAAGLPVRAGAWSGPRYKKG